MKNDDSEVPDARRELDEAARFPEENPNPVLRAGADGCLLYANRASAPLLAAWSIAGGDALPPVWQQRVAAVLAAGAAQTWDEPCGNRLLQLNCVPIREAGYVNIYASDVTERAALLAQLSHERERLAEAARAAEQRAAELEAILEAISDGVVIYGSDGGIARLNAAAVSMLGYRPSDPQLSIAERGERLQAELVDRPAAGLESMPASRAMRGEIVRGELVRLTPVDRIDKSPVYLMASAAPIVDPTGAQLGAVTSFTDVTDLRRARDELNHRVQELEVLLELLPTGIAISYDAEGKDIRVNPALARMLAMPRDANVSLSAEDGEREAQYRVFDQAGRELATEELPIQAAAIRGVEVRDLVIDVEREDGSKITLLSYAVPLVDHYGERRGAVGAYVDITALRAAELEREEYLGALRERSRELEAVNEEVRALNAGLEQRVLERTAELEAIFASVPDALYVADEHGIVRCNDAALAGFGCNSVDELKEKAPLIAERMDSRYADTGQPIPPDELGLARALRGERAVIETLTRHPQTGQEQIHRVTTGPIMLNGQIVAALALGSDITEQQRLQQQLAYQANLLSRISDAVIATDLENRITSWNHAAEAMFGWPEAEVLGRPIADVMPTEFVGTSEREVYRLLGEEGHWRGELRITRRDGSKVDVEAVGVPVRDAKGRVVGLVGVDRDITRRKEAEAKAARLLAELSASREQLRALSRRLVAMQERERSYVADQLYNQAGQVLTALQLQLSRFEKAGDSPAELLAQMHATLNEAIHELHDLAAQLRPAGLDRLTLANVLGGYLAEFSRVNGLPVEFRQRGTESLRVPDEIATALFRSVQEGLANVARHAQATQIAVALSRDASGLTLVLADDGAGFDAQAAASADGVGLASIRERMEAVGGEFDFTSDSRGTVLRLHAPLHRPEAQA